MRYFWTKYFFIRIFYFLITIFFIGNLTTKFGDNERYTSATGYNFALDSTAIVDTVGYILSIFKLPVLQNLPIAICAFFIIKWAVDELQLRSKINNYLLLILLSLPSFCIWTSAIGKEIFGLFSSAVIGVLFINFFNGKFKIRFRDILAFAILLIFKKQYAPFIIQGLFFIWIYNKWKLNNITIFLLGFVCITLQIIFLLHIQETVDSLAMQMFDHFAGGNSTRDDIYLSNGDFFKHLPNSMFIAFWGPTIQEVKTSPVQLLAAIESLFIVISGIKFLIPFILKAFGNNPQYCLYFIVLIVTVGGILFVHTPFGVFNPGSAIRYRTNFIFLFLLIFLQFHIYFEKKS